MKIRWTWTALATGVLAASILTGWLGGVGFRDGYGFPSRVFLYVSACFLLPVGGVGLYFDWLASRDEKECRSPHPRLKMRWTWIMLALGGAYLFLAFSPDLFDVFSEGDIPNSWLECWGEGSQFECGVDGLYLLKLASIALIPIGTLGLLLDGIAWSVSIWRRSRNCG